PKDRTGVLVGNTLTGEQMRLNTTRLRWPLVSRSIKEAADAEGLSSAATDALVDRAAESFKSMFPPMTEDFLAGNLSATIAGRICNYFDFHGGGVSLDAACASSMISVCSACDLLASGQLDIALAGGVDISLDPFELVGFSRAGALTREMI